MIATRVSVVPITWGERSKEVREKFGITQRDLAAMFSLGQRVVSRWERGERIPNGIAKLALLAMFKCDFNPEEFQHFHSLDPVGFLGFILYEHSTLPSKIRRAPRT